MPTSILHPASRPTERHAGKRAPWPVPLDAVMIVLLLSALFAGAILAGLQPHAPADAVQTSVQGGL